MKISIVTVIYNNVETIADTIDSVLNQKYPNIDYWIIDGQSTDGTMDIVREYEPLFGGRLHYISERDNGIYDAMNKGIRLCSGDIVGILNSDDYFTSNDVVGKIVEAFNADEALEAVYGDVHFIHSDEPHKVVRYYSSALFRPFWLRFGFMPAHPSFYVRKDVYEKYGGYALDYKIAADYDMMVRLFMKGHIRAKYIKMDFVTMRIGGVSTKNVKNRILIAREDVKACRKYGVYTNIFFISLKYFYKIFGFLRFDKWHHYCPVKVDK